MSNGIFCETAFSANVFLFILFFGFTNPLGWAAQLRLEEEEERAAFSFDEFGRGQLFQLEICQECTISKIFAQYSKYLDSSWLNWALKKDFISLYELLRKWACLSVDWPVVPGLRIK